MYVHCLLHCRIAIFIKSCLKWIAASLNVPLSLSRNTVSVEADDLAWLLLQGSKSFFSEIISSVSDMKWSSDGRYILARDYMNLKLWDLNMESAPVVTYSVHEHLRAKASPVSLVQDVFELPYYDHRKDS